MANVLPNKKYNVFIFSNIRANIGVVSFRTHSHMIYRTWVNLFNDDDPSCVESDLFRHAVACIRQYQSTMSCKTEIEVQNTGAVHMSRWSSAMMVPTQAESRHT